MKADNKTAARNCIITAMCRFKEDIANRAANSAFLLNYCLKRQTDDGKSRKNLFNLVSRTISCNSMRDLYQLAFNRRKGLLAELYPITMSIEVGTEGRMIIGLGTESVHEVGITLHHTYGTPLIPGSALKGLAAHYCDKVWGTVEQSFKKGEKCHKILFGTTDAAGLIIFHDAWITPDSLPGCLQMDVMTPHHPAYYSSKGKESPPSDFDDPNPLSFLSVVGRFHIVLSCDAEDDEAKKWTSLAQQLLCEALENWGIGGKTAAGYGYLSKDAPKRQFRPPTPTTKTLPRSQTPPVQQGSIVQAELLSEKTKKGSWKAKYANLVGHIQIEKDSTAPDNWKPGMKVNLLVKSVTTDGHLIFQLPPRKEPDCKKKG